MQFSPLRTCSSGDQVKTGQWGKKQFLKNTHFKRTKSCGLWLSLGLKLMNMNL